MKLPAFSLFALDLQLALTRILLQLCLAPHAPLKSADTTFTVTDLGRRDDLNSDFLNSSLKAAPFSILPRPPLLIAVVSGKNGEAQLVRTAALACALATPLRRPIERQGHAGLVNGYTDLPGFPA